MVWQDIDPKGCNGFDRKIRHDKIRKLTLNYRNFNMTNKSTKNIIFWSLFLLYLNFLFTSKIIISSVEAIPSRSSSSQNLNNIFPPNTQRKQKKQLNSNSNLSNEFENSDSNRFEKNQLSSHKYSRKDQQNIATSKLRSMALEQNGKNNNSKGTPVTNTVINQKDNTNKLDKMQKINIQVLEIQLLHLTVQKMVNGY